VGCVILSAAKDLRLARREILRCAQDDSFWRTTRFKKPTRVSFCQIKCQQLACEAPDEVQSIPLLL